MPVYAGMRHIAPRIGDIVKRMAADGVERFVAIAMAPQASSNAAGYRRAVDAALAEIGGGPHGAAGRVRRVVARPAAVHRGPGDDDARGARALRGPDGAARDVHRPQPAGPGPRRRRPVPGRARRHGVPRRRGAGPRRATTFSFQSAGRTGEQWLGPDILEEIRRLGRRGRARARDPARGLRRRPPRGPLRHRHRGAGRRPRGGDPPGARPLDEHRSRLHRRPRRRRGRRRSHPSRSPDAPGGATAMSAPIDPVPAGPARRSPGRPPGRPPVRHHRRRRRPRRGLRLRPGADARVLGDDPRLRPRLPPLPRRPRRPSATRSSSPPRRATRSSTRSRSSAARTRTSCSPAATRSTGPTSRSSSARRPPAGIGASLAPAATPLLTQPVMEQPARRRHPEHQPQHRRLDAERHDGFRMVPGTFDKTLQAAKWARAAGLPIQVNTLVTDETLEDLPAVYELLEGMDIMRWSLFMLITTGRGSGLQEVTPGQSEKLNGWLFELGEDRAVPGQDDRGDALPPARDQESWLADGKTERGDPGDVRRARLRHPRRQRDRVHQPRRDGQPVGLPADPAGQRPDRLDRGPLPRPPGDARPAQRPRRSRAAAAPASTARVCGGSRARAYAWTGDPLEADPLCPYVPTGDVPVYGMPVATTA